MRCAAIPLYSANNNGFLLLSVVLRTMELLRGKPSHITSVCYILLYLFIYCLRLSRKLGPRMIRHSLLIPNKIHTLMSHGSLSPALEPGCLLLQLRSQLGALQAMLGLAEGKNPEEERSGQNLHTWLTNPIITPAS